MPRQAIWISLGIILCIGGCANLQALNPFDASDSPLAVAHQLVSGSYTPAQRQQLVAEVRARYAQNPTDDNRLSVAITYAIPGRADTSTRKVLELLDQLNMDHLSRHSRLVAEWLSSDMAYRQSLESDNRSLSQQNQTLKEALARAKEKIEILTRIEQTIGPEPQLKTGNKNE